MWDLIYFYKIKEAVILFYFGKFSQPGNNKKRALAASTKAFFSKTNGALSPHYEEKNLKAPYIYNRLYIACHQNNA
jgi:hypothetical protein